MKGGSSFGRNGWKRGFSPKKGLKNSFLEYRDSGSIDFGAGWDPQFWKSCHFGYFPWKVWAIRFQMSYGEACWRQCCPIGSHLNFFWRVSRKNAKTGNFLHLVKLSEILLLHHISRVPPCESWRPGRSENVGLIGIWNFWTGVIDGQSRKTLKFWLR